MSNIFQSQSHQRMREIRTTRVIDQIALDSSTLLYFSFLEGKLHSGSLQQKYNLMQVIISTPDFCAILISYFCINKHYSDNEETILNVPQTATYLRIYLIEMFCNVKRIPRHHMFRPVDGEGLRVSSDVANN